MCSSELENLKDSPFIKPIYNILIEKYSGIIPNDIGDYVVELINKSETKVIGIVRWIETTQNLIDNIVSGNAHESEYALFWIYIHEIIFQLYEDENETREINELISFKKPIMIALDKMHALLNNNEFILFRFMRHSHAHIYLNSIWSSVRLKNNLITKIQNPALLGALDIFNSLLQQHENNQNKMTIYYAKLFSPGVNELLIAYRLALSIKI